MRRSQSSLAVRSAASLVAASGMICAFQRVQVGQLVLREQRIVRPVVRVLLVGDGDGVLIRDYLEGACANSTSPLFEVAELLDDFLWVHVAAVPRVDHAAQRQWKRLRELELDGVVVGGGNRLGRRTDPLRGERVYLALLERSQAKLSLPSILPIVRVALAAVPTVPFDDIVLVVFDSGPNIECVSQQVGADLIALGEPVRSVLWDANVTGVKGVHVDGQRPVGDEELFEDWVRGTRGGPSELSVEEAGIEREREGDRAAVLRRVDHLSGPGVNDLLRRHHGGFDGSGGHLDELDDFLRDHDGLTGDLDLFDDLFLHHYGLAGHLDYFSYHFLHHHGLAGDFYLLDHLDGDGLTGYLDGLDDLLLHHDSLARNLNGLRYHLLDHDGLAGHLHLFDHFFDDGLAGHLDGLDHLFFHHHSLAGHLDSLRAAGRGED